jgi:hypothetical protein
MLHIGHVGRCWRFRRGTLLGCVAGACLVVCSGARAQSINVVSRADVPIREVAAFEAAVTVQAAQLARFWHTPRVTFGLEGWMFEIVPGDDPRLGGSRGWHGWLGGRPYAMIAAGATWTKVASHELMEMLVDPRGSGWLDGFAKEICDPVKRLSYLVQRVRVADFVTPAWFTGGSGRFDFLNRVSAARSVQFGFVMAYDRSTGQYRRIGRGPF